MKNIFTSLILLLFSSSYFSQNVNILKIEDLEKRIHNNTDTTYVIDFWATWCAPCVKELPCFDSINSFYANSKVKVILVSMDFKENINTKLLTFIKSKNIKSEIMLLDELNGNYFIPKISDNWSGSMPATLIINDKRKTNRFFEKKINYTFLKSEIDSVLNK